MQNDTRASMGWHRTCPNLSDCFEVRQDDDGNVHIRNSHAPGEAIGTAAEHDGFIAGIMRDGDPLGRVTRLSVDELAEQLSREDNLGLDARPYLVRAIRAAREVTLPAAAAAHDDEEPF
jgi:hypothetical protein